MASRASLFDVNCHVIVDGQVICLTEALPAQGEGEQRGEFSR